MRACCSIGSHPTEHVYSVSNLLVIVVLAKHLEHVNKKVDHVIVQRHSAKDVILFAHLILGVLATVCFKRT